MKKIFILSLFLFGCAKSTPIKKIQYGVVSGFSSTGVHGMNMMSIQSLSGDIYVDEADICKGCRILDTVVFRSITNEIEGLKTTEQYFDSCVILKHK